MRVQFVKRSRVEGAGFTRGDSTLEDRSSDLQVWRFAKKGLAKKERERGWAGFLCSLKREVIVGPGLNVAEFRLPVVSRGNFPAKPHSEADIATKTTSRGIKTPTTASKSYSLDPETKGVCGVLTAWR